MLIKASIWCQPRWRLFSPFGLASPPSSVFRKLDLQFLPLPGHGGGHVMQNRLIIVSHSYGHSDGTRSLHMTQAKPIKALPRNGLKVRNVPFPLSWVCTWRQLGLGPRVRQARRHRAQDLTRHLLSGSCKCRIDPRKWELPWIIHHPCLAGLSLAPTWKVVNLEISSPIPSAT